MRWVRRGPLDVQLTVDESLPRLDVSGLRRDFEVIVFNLPICRPALGTLPRGEVFALEKDNGIRGRPAGPLLRACVSGRNGERQRPVPVMDLPLASGLCSRAGVCSSSGYCDQGRSYNYQAHGNESHWAHRILLWSEGLAMADGILTGLPLRFKDPR